MEKIPIAMTITEASKLITSNRKRRNDSIPAMIPVKIRHINKPPYVNAQFR